MPVYPELPEQRVYIYDSSSNKIDLSTKYGLILLDGWESNPPEPKTYTVDIPGGNGTIDLTEAVYGDVPYNNRSHSFSFMVILEDDSTRETVKTKINNLLNGQKYKYQLSWDPEYYYTGRFTVTNITEADYTYPGFIILFTVTTDTEPYKHKETQTISVDATGGTVITLGAGREKVCPTIEVNNGSTIIEFDGKRYTLPIGSWTINDIYISSVNNQIYVNSYRVFGLKWGNVKESGSNPKTWEEWSHKRLYEWYKTSSDGTAVIRKWADLSDTWGDHSDETWNELMYTDASIPTNAKHTYIAYEVGDL